MTRQDKVAALKSVIDEYDTRMTIWEKRVKERGGMTVAMYAEQTAIESSLKRNLLNLFH